MKKLLLAIASLLIAALAYADGEVEYIDSLTNVKILYSESYEIEHMDGFQKAIIATPKTNIRIYSRISDDGKQMDWEEVNKFDSGNSYGSLLRYERAPNEIDGWIRYCANKDGNGRPYTTCVILIRGHNYAFYMTESAYDEEDLTIPAIMETAEFPKAKRESESKEKTGWILLVALTVAPLIFFKPLKKMPETAVIILGVIATIAETLIYLFFIHMHIEVLYLSMITFTIWLIILGSNSQKSLFESLWKLLRDNV